MPWTTPTLKDVRRLTRDYVLSQLGAKAMIPNSALRIMSDAKAGLAHLVLLYIDWLAKQLLPDTAEQEWLDRHGNIWLKNADGSKGRKPATFADGSVTFEGDTPGIVIPAFSVLHATTGIDYQTTAEAEIGNDLFASAPVEALTAGTIGNLDEGDTIALLEIVPGVSSAATVVTLGGGVDEENDDDLRQRVLDRIQKPPMGGDADDYIAWAKAVAGVTRAWAAQEMGIGTVTVRFMMDELRADNHGLPTPDDVARVRAYLDTVRPVTVKDMFVEAPVPLFYDITLFDLEDDSETVRAKIESAIREMEYRRAGPNVTWWRSWIEEAVSGAAGEDHHGLIFNTPTDLGLPNDRSLPMPNPGNMPMLGTINYSDA